MYSLILLEHTGWQWRRDKNRGDKDFFITGRWTAQGHGRPIDPTYPAGKAGKMEAKLSTGLHEVLYPLACIASNLLRKWRPDLISRLEALPSEESYFDLFHLFMSPRGVAKMHKDKNDFISVLFPIEMEMECRGSLEIGGTGQCFDWKLSDAVLLDSAKLFHGTRDYLGAIEGRLIGIFIVHNPFLTCNGV